MLRSISRFFIALLLPAAFAGCEAPSAAPAITPSSPATFTREQASRELREHLASRVAAFDASLRDRGVSEEQRAVIVAELERITLAHAERVDALGQRFPF